MCGLKLCAEIEFVKVIFFCAAEGKLRFKLDPITLYLAPLALEMLNPPQPVSQNIGN